MPADTLKGVRDAFSAGEFARAQRLFGEYAGEIGAAARNGTARPAMLSEARELLDWAQLAAAAFRAHALDRLNGARLAQTYQPATPPARHSVRVSL